jgi:hypothetical protein
MKPNKGILALAIIKIFIHKSKMRKIKIILTKKESDLSTYKTMFLHFQLIANIYRENNIKIDNLKVKI